MNIYVANLSFDLREEELKDFFTPKSMTRQKYETNAYYYINNKLF